MRRVHSQPPAAPNRVLCLVRIALTASAAVVVAGCTTTTTTSTGAPSNVSSPTDAVPSYRSFPQRSLRGEFIVVAAPEVRLNGKSTRLSAGSKVRNEGNMIVMPTTLTNQRLVVNYTFDLTGQVQDVWILSSRERAAAWPRTPEEAQRWEFDVVRQAWNPR